MSERKEEWPIGSPLGDITRSEVWAPFGRQVSMKRVVVCAVVGATVSVVIVCIDSGRLKCRLEG